MENLNFVLEKPWKSHEFYFWVSSSTLGTMSTSPKKVGPDPIYPKITVPPYQCVPPSPRCTPSIRPGGGGGPGGVQLWSQLMLKSLQVQRQRHPKRWVDPDPIYPPGSAHDSRPTDSMQSNQWQCWEDLKVKWPSRDGQMVATSPQVGTGKICMAIARPIPSPQAIFWHGNWSPEIVYVVAMQAINRSPISLKSTITLGLYNYIRKKFKITILWLLK